MSDSETGTTDTPAVLTGRVKWFNNKAGYGFITVGSEGEWSDKDVFVHHSAVCTGQEQYKYLVQGEYVNFQLSQCSDGGSHDHQAEKVGGLFGGKLMCETRNENRTRIADQNQEEGEDGQYSNQRYRNRDRGERIHVRGQGPREGEEFILVRSNSNSTRARGGRDYNRDSSRARQTEDRDEN
jgi:cold shock CspA family protein